MIHYFITSIAVVAMLILAGCGKVVGKTVVQYDRGGAPNTTIVARDGTYGLFGLYDSQPKVTVPLRKNDRIGFTEREGRLIAIAGREEYEVSTTMVDRTIAWKRVEN